jgi:hypothetical protein
MMTLARAGFRQPIVKIEVANPFNRACQDLKIQWSPPHNRCA